MQPIVCASKLSVTLVINTLVSSFLFGIVQMTGAVFFNLKLGVPIQFLLIQCCIIHTKVVGTKH